MANCKNCLSKIENHGKLYCSISCAAKDRKPRKHTEESKRKIGIGNKGEKNGQWKGDSVGYAAIHDYIKYYKPKPEACESCGRNVSLLDLANISQEYRRDLDDWEYICRSCHMNKDGRINNLKYQGINSNAKALS